MKRSNDKALKVELELLLKVCYASEILSTLAVLCVISWL